MATQDRWAGAADQVTGGGTVAWINLSGCVGDDLFNEANASGGQIAEDTSSHLLRLTNFGFAIPAGATVDGIRAQLYLRHSDDYVADTQTVQLLLAGALVGDNAAFGLGDTWGGPHSGGYLTSEDYGDGGPYGTPLWGRTWTPAEINDPSFGIALQAMLFAPVTIAYVGGVHLTVRYTAAAGATTRPRFRPWIGA